MKKTLLICLLGYLCVPTSTSTAQVADSPPGTDLVYQSGFPGQEGESPSAYLDTLTIGDQIPSGIEFSEVLQFDSDKLRLDDYRGKYVILEFWAPTCTASIASLPQLDAIQRKYGDRIAVIPVSVFEEERVSLLLENYKSLQNLTLPLVVNSKRLLAYFPHFVIPHLIVLDPDGKILAITGMEDLTESNLNTLLATGVSPFRIKTDKKIRIGSKTKLIAETPEIQHKNIWFQSAFTGYIPDLRGSLTQDYSSMSHIRLINMPLINHFQLAYSERDLVDYFGRNRMELLGFEEEELWTDGRGMDYVDWMAKGDHVFGYELIAPLSMNPYVLMREDLKRFLPHIQASVVSKKKKVYALVKQQEGDFPKAEEEEKSYKMLSVGVSMTNYPLQGFVYHLNTYFLATSEYPIINLTGIDYPIDLTLVANLSDVESLRTALRQNGLDLKEQYAEIPVLVLEKISPPKLLMP
ncbi:TlpA family protein disulfide reductase [Algoriphagus yeomjeoni]|uniref:Thiol-disulfide isomerase/thioredoxin n=1 Tax=Algoriphagus yeomjeoni TaxID=291403 RepID=A0A327PQD4_9BACT|nr:TlpA disulfide reductase family protein [Algoriphagus yeomjeoni]RAI93837.1 thiol-disulfide isomerase/thioredoxin [Algoriphagus yeomjeoni]